MKIWLFGLFAGVMALFGVYFMGKKASKSEEKLETVQEVLKNVEKDKKLKFKSLNAAQRARLRKELGGK